MTPYGYCANNPVKYVDPTGEFPISEHKKIISSAMSRTGLIPITTSLFLSDLMFGVGVRADIIGIASDYHFDGRQNFRQVQSTWKQLNANINRTINNIGSVNIKLGGFDVVSLGKELHTVADFYAHSNYVDLYVDYYKSNNNGKMPTSIPTYDEGMQDAGFKKILVSKLRTGDFHLLDNEKFDINPFRENADEPTSHNKMNKDDVSTTYGRLAKDVATKHSVKILNQVKEKMND